MFVTINQLILEKVLGSPSSGKEVHVDYTMTAVKMLLESVVPTARSGKPFRFVYIGSGLVPMYVWAGEQSHPRHVLMVPLLDFRQCFLLPGKHQIRSCEWGTRLCYHH